MRGFHNNSFDPQTLVVLEAAFDEAWLTLKAIGNTTVKPDELARSVLALAMEGERDPVRLHDGALKGLVPAASWREAGVVAVRDARPGSRRRRRECRRSCRKISPARTESIAVTAAASMAPCAPDAGTDSKARGAVGRREVWQ